jgi:alpha-galactosidase
MKSQHEDPHSTTPSATPSASAVSRRSFLGVGAAAAGAFAASPAVRAASSAPASSSYLALDRLPDSVAAFTHFDHAVPAGYVSLARNGQQWSAAQIEVETTPQPGGLALALSASAPVVLIHVRWNAPVLPSLQVLGDAWERSYGDLAWRTLVPERVLPWYFATWDRTACHAYGVRTDARALCFWQLDPDGVSLWLNVANGGSGVVLGSRRLVMATVLARRGHPGQPAIDALSAFCHSLCARPSRPIVAIYGANDWDYSYGSSTAESIVRDSEFIASISPTSGVRPFSVVDGGWENGTAAWPDMGKLAADIARLNVRPGIWIRPLEAPKDTPPAQLLPGGRFGSHRERTRELAYDPTVPEAREKIRAKMAQAVGWGYQMVKHDFSTYDLLGQWGFEMGPQPTLPGWSLADRTRTNAEVLADLYALLRDQAGPATLIDGCNTIGHLGQGVVDLQRTGDDTSGRHWERTRRMGVNTAAFRLPQNGAFFVQDPDIIPITEALPWELSRQWLDLVASSGQATLISAAPAVRQGAAQQAALREAFKVAASGGVGAKPIDWMETTAPSHWRARGADRRYDWTEPGGVSAFISQ